MATIKFRDLPLTNLLATLPISTLNEIYSSLLLETIALNDCSTKNGIGTRGPITRFHSKVPPPLPVQDYLARLTKFTPFPRDALLLSSIYLNRITHLSLSTAYSSLETFTDDPIPRLNSNKTPQPFIKSFEPLKPKPVVIFSPVVLPQSSRSYSNGSLPSFSLSSSPLNDNSNSDDPLRQTQSPPPTSSTTTTCSLPVSPSLSPYTTNSTSSTSSSSPSSSSRKLRPAPLLNNYTLHRLVLSSLLIATKYTVDGTLSQTRAAKVGGVSTTELTRLESEGLRLLGWGLYVDKDELEGVFKVWVERGRNLGLIPKLEQQEQQVEGSGELFRVQERAGEGVDGITSLQSPPKVEIPLSSSNQSLQIPFAPHETNSTISTVSSSSSSSTTSSTTASSLSCSPSTNQIIEGGGGGEEIGTPKGRRTSLSNSTPPSSPGETPSNTSDQQEINGETEGGEDTPTKALKRVQLAEGESPERRVVVNQVETIA